MTREAAERCLAKRTEHAMRDEAIHAGLERAGEAADAAEAYGCVDWFLYDAPTQDGHLAPPTAAPRRDAGTDDASAH